MKPDVTSAKNLVKIFIVSIIFLQALSTNTQAQSCTFVSPTVQFVSITSNAITGKCEYLVNLEFDVQINGGNKYIFVHLWEQSRYHVGSGGTVLPFSYATQPTDDAGAPSGILYSSLVNIGINSFNEPASFYSTYPPDATVPMAHPATMPGLTVTETTVNSNTSRYVIENVKIVLPGPCTANPTFSGDAWSTNGASANQVQCKMEGFTTFGPTADGSITCSDPANSLSFTIAKDGNSTATDLNVDVYVDRNGDGRFNSADDAPAIDTDGDIGYHITSANSPLTVTNSSVYYPASIAADPILAKRKLFVVLKNIVVTNSDATTTAFTDAFVKEITNGCATLPVKFGEVYASSKNGRLYVTWQSLRETNCRDYEIQGSPNGTGWHTIGRVASMANRGNSDVPLSYSFSETTMALGGLSLAALLLFLPVARKRTARTVTILVIAIIVYSCAKQSNNSRYNGETTFLRIIQHNTDNSSPTYSRVVKVVPH